MSDLQQQNIANKPRNRRAVVKGAVWSVPVIAAAIAAPAASASVANAGLAWTGSNTGLLSLQLLDGVGLITAQVLMTVPSKFTITNGPGPISGNATVTIAVGRPGGINLTLGEARGFGVYSLDGVLSTAGQRTVTYNTLPLVGKVGFPLTTFTTTKAVTIPSNGVLDIPVVFGLAGTSGVASISALASFPVTLTVDFGAGNVYTASSVVSVPVGAGIL